VGKLNVVTVESLNPTVGLGLGGRGGGLGGEVGLGGGEGGGLGGGISDGMLRVIGEQNKVLLQSQMDQLREMKDMFNSVLKNNRITKIPSQS